MQTGNSTLDSLILQLNTNLTIPQYCEQFMESRTAVWRAINEGHLEVFNRGKRKFITGRSAAKRNNLEHLLRQATK